MWKPHTQICIFLSTWLWGGGGGSGREEGAGGGGGREPEEWQHAFLSDQFHLSENCHCTKTKTYEKQNKKRGGGEGGGVISIQTVWTGRTGGWELSMRPCTSLGRMFPSKLWCVGSKGNYLHCQVSVPRTTK